MESESFWSRLRKGRFVQVLLIYLGASWLVLQIADTLEDALALPDWVLPTAFLLLLVGLVVVVATAWMQSHPLARERAAAEEVPHAWELDTRDLRGSLREGRLPHLTWPRALLGGAVAFLLLSTIAALVMLVARDGELGSASAARAAVLPGLAVMPFTVSGEGADVWREGMVDLLSTNLDGAAGLRTIDSRNVLARWRERFGDGDADAEQALDAARATDARYALLGNAVSLGDRVRLTADLYDLETGAQLGQSARAEGPRDSLFAVIDRFSVAIVREALRAEGVTRTGPLRGVESLTTSSLPALLSFLEGEALFRRAEFQGAIDAYEAAVAADSTFALPHYRLSHAYGWAQSILARATADAGDRAARHAHRLGPRDAALVRLAGATLGLGIADSIAPLRALAQRYPDDPEIWHELGEAVVHIGSYVPLPVEIGREAFLRAIALDSSFAPAYIHPMELAIGRGDYAEARRLLDAYDRFGDDERHQRLTRMLAIYEGTAPASLLDTIADTSLRDLHLSGLIPASERPDALARISAEVTRRAGLPEGTRALGRVVGSMTHLMAGQPDSAFAQVDELPPAPALLVRYFALQLGIGDHETLRPLAARLDEDAALHAQVLAGVVAIHRRDAAGRDVVVERLRERARELADTTRGVPSERDLVAAQTLRAAASVVQAYDQWHRGDAAAALTGLERARHHINGVTVEVQMTNELTRYWTALVLEDLDRHRDAAPLYESLRWNPVAFHHAARAWETAGETERARAAWARAASAWRSADPGFALAGEARAGLERTSPDR